MKVAIITDQHLGCRNDNPVIAAHHAKFYENVFFPTLKERGIDTVLDLGDLFDRRKFINYNTLNFWYERYFDKLRSENITLHSIVGNHNTYFTNTNSINSLNLLLEKYPNVHIYNDAPVELELDHTKILMVPWLCRENRDASFDAIKKTKAQIAMGHFSIVGFEMVKGRLCDSGLDRSLFDKFSTVYSGHFHTQSSQGQIKYLGAPYEINWGDSGEKRGFHIFDTTTHDLEFVPNPYQIFYLLNYDGSDMKIEDLDRLELARLESTYLKVLVKDRGDPYVFDMFIDRLTAAKVADTKIIDNVVTADMSEIEAVTEADDTPTIIEKCVDDLRTGVDKKLVLSTLLNVHAEALNL